MSLTWRPRDVKPIGRNELSNNFQSTQSARLSQSSTLANSTCRESCWGEANCSTLAAAWDKTVAVSASTVAVWLAGAGPMLREAGPKATAVALTLCVTAAEVLVTKLASPL